MVDKSQEAAFENFENLYEALKVLERFKEELKESKRKLLTFLKGNDLYFRDYCACEWGCKNDEARRCLERNGIDETEFLFEKSCGKELGDLGVFFYDERRKDKETPFNSYNFTTYLGIAAEPTKQAFQNLNFGTLEASLLKLNALLRQYNDLLGVKEPHVPALESLEREISETLTKLKTLDAVNCVLNGGEPSNSLAPK